MLKATLNSPFQCVRTCGNCLPYRAAIGVIAQMAQSSNVRARHEYQFTTFFLLYEPLVSWKNFQKGPDLSVLTKLVYNLVMNHRSLHGEIMRQGSSGSCLEGMWCGLL